MKYRIELIQKLEQSEYLVSFDINSLCPNVAINTAKIMIEHWLEGLKLDNETTN